MGVRNNFPSANHIAPTHGHITHDSSQFPEQLRDNCCNHCAITHHNQFLTPFCLLDPFPRFSLAPFKLHPNPSLHLILIPHESSSRYPPTMQMQTPEPFSYEDTRVSKAAYDGKSVSPTFTLHLLALCSLYSLLSLLSVLSLSLSALPTSPRFWFQSICSCPVRLLFPFLVLV